ncbi:lipid IV(A) 3-deoxy-D-manno-octulosonic acid transferase [Thauera linaloolentis]|uniref:3-deoxy-D-manno-octulosonic acid transferase n=1 Tax=Thauera linaloolentis (strain DSM 12138 / JCM 21573 / CCUG 41526 / CIP 105981 / IAM 15112 / NBRC 102519 / 47Lol) TaxID=1123367 RepID=N6Y6E0_THAL4|nr:lipid IV(A) 3-deoxy-D-manno-octulosonic acid transferase [Thauera linaloolentis]ENO89766.1 3-deoxy-D-manno-octulosonic-acid transferase [Thauera linaloolentis 47Lol = DSM 12138]MCM8566064.1 lipid IV(A) 3-deoxy-D-manno-octulosonic acid transferase [Thauera linaloolentis]
MLTRLPYTLLWIFALPFVLLRLVWRERRQPGYLKHLGERFGRYTVRAPTRVIWLHAVSVGETRAAEPLVKALLQRWPEHSVLLTHMTLTGRETSQSLFGGNARVLRSYLPYDLGCFAHAFLRHFRPQFGVIMETELWPNLLAACRQRKVPVMLANARLSERSARRYARLPALSAMTMGALSAIGAQTAADAARLSALGARRVLVTGNIKFDITPPDDAIARASLFRTRIGTRPVLLAASTRDGEESLLLDAFARLAPPDVLLMLVPRHPQRFDEVARLACARGLKLQRRSEDAPVDAGTRVWLGDSMGEMFGYYAAADAALIGGSWLPFGGQNLIEACAVGTPAIVGPHTFNFTAVAEQAIDAGAAWRAADTEEGIRMGLQLLADEETRRAMATAGLAFAEADRGASTRTLEMLESLKP